LLAENHVGSAITIPTTHSREAFFRDLLFRYYQTRSISHVPFSLAFTGCTTPCLNCLVGNWLVFCHDIPFVDFTKFPLSNATKPGQSQLVAASLERQWEEKLVLQRQVEENAERFHQRHQLPTLTAEMRYQLAHIGQILPGLWESGKISNEYKKRLLRSLITRVIATRLAPDQIEVKIVWISGHFSVVQVTPPIHRQADVSNYEEICARIDELFHNGSTDG
jgi:hypothetical protein